MSKIAKFVLGGEDEGRYILIFPKTELDAVQLQLHWDMGIVRKQKVNLLALCDVTDLFSGEQGK